MASRTASSVAITLRVALTDLKIQRFVFALFFAITKRPGNSDQPEQQPWAGGVMDFCSGPALMGDGGSSKRSQQNVSDGSKRVVVVALTGRN